MTYTQEQKEEVWAVIAKFGNNEKPFTALDITLAVNKNAYIPHRTIREIVKNSMNLMDELEDYTTSTIEVELEGGATAQAILYHHTDYDPEEYTERSKTLQSNVSPPSTYDANPRNNVRDRTRPTRPDLPIASPVVTLDDDASATNTAQKILDDLGAIGDPTKDNDNDDILSFRK